MSLEAWGDEGFDADPVFDEARVEDAFREGLRACREYMARFIEQGGDALTAASIRANWNPAWGADAGPVIGEISIDAWGMTTELRERCRANVERIMDEHAALATEPHQHGGKGA